MSFKSVMLGDVQAARRTLQARYLRSVCVLELKSQQGAVPFTVTLSFCSCELFHTPVCARLLVNALCTHTMDITGNVCVYHLSVLSGFVVFWIVYPLYTLITGTN